MKENVIFEIRTQTNVKMNYCPFYWELRSDLKITFNNKTFKVPKKFKTDFASIPKFLKPFVPNRFIYNPIAVLHDYLYSIGENETDRKSADKILKKGLYYYGNKSLSAKIYSNLFYVAVRLFGKSHFNNPKTYDDDCSKLKLIYVEKVFEEDESK